MTATSHRTIPSGQAIVDTEVDLVVVGSGTGLAAALHDHPQVPSCLVKRVFAYGTGSPASADEKSTLDYLNKNFAAGGYRLRNLLRTVVMSSAFSTVSSPTPEPAKSASVVHGSSGASPVKTDIKTDAQ